MELKQKNNLFSAPIAGKRPWFVLFLPVFLLFFLLVFSNSAKAAIVSGYVSEGIAFYAYETQQAGTIPVYRLYSSTRGDHFYTASETEKNRAVSISGYKYEQIAFYVYESQQTGTVPVYRLYNGIKGDHFYTTSETEKNRAVSISGYKYEGIAFYGYSTQSEGTSPVYRLMNNIIRDHFYTISEIEKDEYLAGSLGAEITVGLWSYTRDQLKDESFKIHANKNYNIKNKDGKIIAKVSAGVETRVKYNGDGKLKIYNSISSTIVDKEVYFDATDGNNSSLIFDVHRPSSSFDKYRGKIKVRYSSTTKKIWIINNLPLEQYAWGNGEITGTGDADYNRAMATVYRTYGYWKIKYSTKYATEGFKVTSDSGSQIYRGYDWEKDHLRIKQAAQDTRGRIMKYGSEIALSPYSSWTDGRTRSFYERWGSKDYPWCQSVKDPYGKHPTMTTAQLEAAGNHMVGLSAHGALHLAGSHDWSWGKILQYYFTNIKISSVY